MNLLANVLPGMSELRAPLAAGTITLLAVWLAVEPGLPAAEDATGLYGSILELDSVVSTIGATAVLGFVAYLVGAVIATGSAWVMERCLYRDPWPPRDDAGLRRRSRTGQQGSALPGRSAQHAASGGGPWQEYGLLPADDL